MSAAEVTVAPLDGETLGAAFDVYEATWPRPLPPQAGERFASWLGHLVATDPDGAWIALRDGAAIGFASAHVRDGLAMLSALFVRPEEQVRGLGRALLERALAAADGPRALIPASGDPRATRRYARAGCAVHPAMRAEGRPDLRGLAPDPAVRAGTHDDLELMTAIDRRVRGAARPAELARLLDDGARALVLERRPAAVASPRRPDGPAGERRSSGGPGGHARRGGRGYALCLPGRPPFGGTPLTLVAEDDAAARALLLRALAEADGEVAVDGLTASQRWAFEVADAAGLALVPSGPLCLRGLPSLPSGWLPSPFFA